MQAFFDLDSERSLGFGVGRIPWSSIVDYAAAYDFDGFQLDHLMYFIKHLDGVHLEHLNEKAKEK